MGVMVRHKKKWLAIITCGLLVVLMAIVANSASIVNSRHDLDWAASYGDMAFWDPYNDYGEVCVYCHAPHGGDASAPLWNRTMTTASFTMYSSSTIDTTIPNAPSGVSLACLSCHDGTLAVDAIINMPGSGNTPSGVPGDLDSWTPAASGHGKLSTTGNGFLNCAVACHGGIVISGTDFTPAVLGTDLSNDHPISMTYPTPGQDPYFKTPAEVNSAGLKLYDNKVECSSCHNVHDPANKPFLRKNNSGSELCTACHTK
jgi:predicted CXXCH cytochrome family protein